MEERKRDAHERKTKQKKETQTKKMGKYVVEDERALVK
jgi:hypothetical protein